jgi:hypothetical protein
MFRRSKFYSPFVVGASAAILYVGMKVKQNQLNNENTHTTFGSGLRTLLRCSSLFHGPRFHA